MESKSEIIYQKQKDWPRSITGLSENHVAIGFVDKAIEVCDCDAKESVIRFAQEEAVCSLLKLSDNTFISGSSETIRIWDWQKREGRDIIFPGYGVRWFTALAISSENKLAIGTEDEVVLVYDLETMMVPFSVPAYVKSLAFVCANKLAMAVKEHGIVVMDIETADVEFAQNPDVNQIITIDGHKMVSGGYDKTIRLLDWNAKKQVMCLKCNDSVRSVKYMKENLVAGTTGNEVFTWDLRCQKRTIIGQSESPIWYMDKLSDNSLAAAEGSVVRRWRLE